MSSANRRRSRSRRQPQPGFQLRRWHGLAAVGLVAVIAIALFIPSRKGDANPRRPDVTAVLVGADLSAQTQAQAFALALKAATVTKGPLLVGPMDAGSSSFREDLSGVGAYEIQRTENLTKAVAAAEKDFQAVRLRPTSGYVIDGLRNLALSLNDDPGHVVDVLMLGQATKVARGVDLADPITRGDPRAAVQALVNRGLLPDCRGWRVNIVGGSRAGNQAVSSDFDVQAQEFWRRLIDQCGGRMTGWNPTQLGVFPASVPIGAVSRGPDCDLLFSLSGQTLFDSGQSLVRNEAGPLLSRLARAIRNGGQITVQGHTDSVGSPRFNLRLSQARAEAVKTWLTSRERIPASRVSTEGFGSGEPIASNKTLAGRQLNRRVDVRVTAPAVGCQ